MTGQGSAFGLGEPWLAPCPFCNKPNYNHSGLTDDSRPEPGYFAICWTCRQWSVFNDMLQLRPPTREEYRWLETSEEANAILAALQTPQGQRSPILLVRVAAQHLERRRRKGRRA